MPSPAVFYSRHEGLKTSSDIKSWRHTSVTPHLMDQLPSSTNHFIVYPSIEPLETGLLAGTYSVSNNSVSALPGDWGHSYPRGCFCPQCISGLPKGDQVYSSNFISDSFHPESPCFISYIHPEVFSEVNRLPIEEQEFLDNSYGSPQNTEHSIPSAGYPGFEGSPPLLVIPFPSNQEESHCSSEFTSPSPISCRTIDLLPEPMVPEEHDTKPIITSKLTVSERARNVNGKFICPECHRRYARRDRMQTCQNNHRDYRAYVCAGKCGHKHCTMSYASPDSLRRHLWPKNQRQVICEICSRRTSRQNYARHRKRCLTTVEH